MERMASISDMRRNDPVTRRDFFTAGFAYGEWMPEHCIFLKVSSLQAAAEPGTHTWKEAGLG